MIGYCLFIIFSFLSVECFLLGSPPSLAQVKFSCEFSKLWKCALCNKFLFTIKMKHWKWNLKKTIQNYWDFMVVIIWILLRHIIWNSHLWVWCSVIYIIFFSNFGAVLVILFVVAGGGLEFKRWRVGEGRGGRVKDEVIFPYDFWGKFDQTVWFQIMTYDVNYINLAAMQTREWD